MNGPATILLAVATLVLAGAQSLDGEMGHQIIKKYAMMKVTPFLKLQSQTCSSPSSHTYFLRISCREW